MEGGGFVSEGGYGCTYYPEISCSGKETTNKNFLSKIQLNDDSAKNEIKISKLLKNALSSGEPPGAPPWEVRNIVHLRA